MKFTLPDQLPEDPAELQKLAAQATAEINVIQAKNAAFEAGVGVEMTNEDVDYLVSLTAAHKTVSDALAAATGAETADADRRSAAIAAATAATSAPAAEKADVEPEAEAAAGVDAAESAAEVVAEAETVAAEAAEKVEVPSFGAAVTKNDVPDVEPGGDDKKIFTFLPSAPNFAEFAGKKVDSRTLAEAILLANPGSATGGHSTGQKMRGGRAFSTQALARIDRPQPGDPIENAQQLHVALDRIANAAKTTALALLAAGGWVSPSERLYDFCATPAAGNLLSLPEIPIIRGGVTFPADPDFSSLFTGIYHFTETELEAVDGGGDPTADKAPVEVPAVDDWIEYRLEAMGYYIKAGILQNQGWPELVQKFVDEFLVEYQYYVSGLTVTKMVTQSDAARVVPTSAVLGATTAILNGLHVRARNLQIATRVNTIEGVAPIWFRDVLRADLAMRDGMDALSVTDAQVDSWLAERGIYLQYEGRWQSLAAGKPGNYDTDWWPGSVNVLLYPAGTFFRSLNNVITLGVQYPMDQVEFNRYTHAFVEDSILVGKRCFPSHQITIPLCENGAIGAREVIDCSGPYAATKQKTITVTGTPTGGNFPVYFTANPTLTATIAYNSTNSQAKTAIAGIDDSYLAASFTVNGGALPGTPLVVTYPAELGDLKVGTPALTGGTAPAVAVS